MKSRLPVVVCCLLTTLLVGIWLGQTLPLNREVDVEIVERSTVSPFNSDGWQLASGQNFGPAATLPVYLAPERESISDPAAHTATGESSDSTNLSTEPDVAYFPEAITEAAAETSHSASEMVKDAHSQIESSDGSLSEEEAAIWNAELKDLPPGQAEEILRLRQQLGPVASESLGFPFTESTATNQTEPPGLFPELSAGDARPIPIVRSFPEESNIVHAAAIQESPLAKKLREEARRNYAENTANAQTPGYKRRQIVILNVPVALSPTETAHADLAVSDASSEVASPAEHPALPWVSRLDLRQGKLISTSNPLDLAIDGPGWLQVDRNGTPEYFRGGVLAFNQNRELCVRTSEGLLPIQPTITLPEGSRRITITETGEIIADDFKGSQKEIGHLLAFEFLNASALKRTAIGTYAETKETAGVIASNSSVRFLQSFLEAANVDLQRELTEFDHLQTVAEKLASTSSHETASSINPVNAE